VRADNFLGVDQEGILSHPMHPYCKCQMVGSCSAWFLTFKTLDVGVHRSFILSKHAILIFVFDYIVKDKINSLVTILKTLVCQN
jgi:hypothetical protein